MFGSLSFPLVATSAVILLVLSPAAPRLTRERRQAAVSPSCYSPAGSDCSWYRNCLEKRVPCQGKQGDYAIAYGDKFCNKYRNNYQRFSAQGKKWVDAVRKCLQVKLVPILRTAPSCSDIKSAAFASHVPCYLNPGGGAPKLCDLSVADLKVIRQIISGAFVSAFWDTLAGELRVAIEGGCTVKLLLSLL